MPDVRQESQWILRAQCGDREALELLLSGAQATLTNYVRRLVGPSLTDDVLQDTLIIIAEKLRWLERPDLFRPWTFRIASRLAFRRLKKERRWRSDDSQLEHLSAPDTRPAEDLLHTLLTEDVISPASRAVFVLHFRSFPAGGGGRSRHSPRHCQITAGLRSRLGPQTSRAEQEQVMSQDDTILRKSLDAVERRRSFAIITVVIAIVVTLGAFFRHAQAFSSDADVRRLLQLSLVAMIFWTSGLTIIVVLQLAAMTRRVLRAIELASKRE
jgi:hypothetical protein